MKSESREGARQKERESIVWILSKYVVMQVEEASLMLRHIKDEAP